MRLIVQPDDGLAPLIEAIQEAKTSIEIVIFRFDRREMEHALAAAVVRGVAVSALIAHTNHTGEELLRKLEQRMLAAGVTVARTANDFDRYHSKVLIVDRSELFVLGFNYTGLDIERSRSFGIVTKDKKTVREALRLFDADCKRLPYTDGIDDFVVSPANARQQLSDLIQSAERELSIYDVAVSDQAMLRLLEQRAKAGVQVRIIGGAKSKTLQRRVLAMRLHARTIIRDRDTAFIGSQSLRKAELDKRREVGLIFRNEAALATLCARFEEDWAIATEAPLSLDSTAEEFVNAEPSRAGKVAKHTAKAILKGLPEIAPMVEEILQNIAPGAANLEINPEELQQSVEDAVKSAVKVAVKAAVKTAEIAEDIPPA